MGQQEQPSLNVGLIGHIDHGKTTLLYKLTGKWTDTHSEELKRGITIKLGYADVTIRKCPRCHEPQAYSTKQKCKICGTETKPVRYVSFIDVPGHEMLMATMLSGAAIIDAALLIVAANEPCPQPQTEEHLMALQAKGIKNVVVVQNKVDLVSPERAKENCEQIRHFLKGTIAEKAPIVPCSAQREINIDAILAELVKLPVPLRDTKSKPVFLVARSFDVNRPGTAIEDLAGGVLGGLLKVGTLKVGDEIEIKPGRSEVRKGKKEYKTVKTFIKSLRTGVTELKEAIPSGSLAIQTTLDPLLTKADKLAGCVAGLAGTLPDITNEITLKVKLFSKIAGLKQAVEPLKVRESLLLSVNTSVSLGTVTELRNDKVKLVLQIPIVPLAGSKVGIARNYVGHWRLIGWGELI